MISKKNHPEIELRNKINIEGKECVISQIHPQYSIVGACEVVTQAADPVCRDVCWDGGGWVFSDRPTFVDATKSPRLKEFVEMLQEPS